MSRKIKKFDVVTFSYSISATDGDVLEQSDLPLEYIHLVDGRMWDKVEQALTGHGPGDKVTVAMAPADAFGEADPQLIIKQPIAAVPPEFRRVGARPQFQNEAGEVREMVVTHVDDDTIVIDGNHPLAGRDLIFVVKVLGIRDATAEEVARREVMSAGGVVQ